MNAVIRCLKANRMFKSSHIAQRLILIVTLISVLILTLVIVIALRSSEAVLQSQASERFADKSQQVAAELDQRLQLVHQTISMLQMDIMELDELDSSSLRQIVREAIERDQSELIYRVNIRRADEAVVTFVIEDPRVHSITEQRVYRPYEAPISADFIAASQEDELNWLLQPQTLFDNQQQPSLTLIAPFTLNDEDHTRSLLWVDIPQVVVDEWLTTTLLAEGLVTIMDNYYTLLLNDDGAIFSAYDPGSDDGQTQQSHDLLAALETEDPDELGLYQLREPIHEQSALVSQNTLPTTGWQLVSITPTASLPTLSSSIIPILFLVSVLGVIVLVVFINRFFVQEIVRPMSNIARAAQEIGSGDMRHFIDYQTREDEIGGLARALEDMKRNIAHSYEELSRWSRTLEQRVRERTEEAESARKVAQSTANELRAVYDESLSVVSQTQLKPILDAFTQRLVTMLKSDYCAIWLLNSKRTQLQLLQSTDTSLDTLAEPITISVEDGISGHSVRAKQAVRVDDYPNYEHYITLPGYDEAPLRCAIAIPMIASGRVIGTVVVGRENESVHYTDDEERIMNLFVNMVAPAVQNAHLLVQRDKAVKAAKIANQVKTRFLASVTHELRTPLNLIINNMDFMRIGAFGDVNAEQVSRLDQTIRSAEHLLYLINDLLDISKIEAGEMQLHIQPTDIQSVIEDALDTAVAILERQKEKGSQISLEANVVDDLPEIPMDARRIRQVLTNLLSNAIKFTEVGDITFDVTRETEGVRFRVTDTGMGIPAEEIPLLFEAFERTAAAKERNVEGTGLGLPISQFLVQQHGSEILVDSEMGKGSTFYFTLPYETPQAVVQSSKSDTQILAVLAVDRSEA